MRDTLVGQHECEEQRTGIQPFCSKIQFFPDKRICLQPVKPQCFACLFRFNQYTLGKINFSLLGGGINGGRIINEVRYPFDHLLLAPAEEVAQQRESCLQRSVIREKTQHDSLQRVNKSMPVPGAVGICPRTGE